MDDWTYSTQSDVDEVLPAQPSLMEEDWPVALDRGVRALQRTEAARIAEDAQAEAQVVRDPESAVAAPRFSGTPAAGFTF